MMNLKIQHIVFFLFLGIYVAFSSGIGVSIHHCCTHCVTVEKEHTCSHAVDDEDAGHCCDQSTEKQEEKHQHHQDDYYFFKIMDNYDKEEYHIVLLPSISVATLLDRPQYRYTEYLYKSIIRIGTDDTDSSIIQETEFIDFSQQRLFYA